MSNNIQLSEKVSKVIKAKGDEPEKTEEVDRFIFKDALINKVQEAFESKELLKITREQETMTKDEIELQYIRRKNRIMGSN